MQTARQDINKNDLEAQLPKLRNITHRAVQQAHEAVEIKEGYLLEIENLEKEIQEKQAELALITAAQDRIKESIQKQEEFQVMSEQEHQQSLDTVRSEIQEKKEELHLISNEIKAIKEKKKQEETEFVDFQTEIGAKKQKINQLLEESSIAIQSKSKMNKKLSQSIEERKKEYEVIKEGIKGVLDWVEKRRNEIYKREEELSSIADSQNALNDRLVQKEADLKVLSNRVKREHERTFPGRKVKI